MSITQGVLAQYPEPEAHDKVLHNNPDRTGILKFGNVGFWGERKTGVPREKPLRERTRTNNKLDPLMMPSLGIEPGPHCWQTSAWCSVNLVLGGHPNRQLPNAVSDKTMGTFFWEKPKTDLLSQIIRIMVHQRNRRILVQGGFVGSFDAPWSEWSEITNPFLDSPKKNALLPYVSFLLLFKKYDLQDVLSFLPFSACKYYIIWIFHLTRLRLWKPDHTCFAKIWKWRAEDYLNIKTHKGLSVKKMENWKKEARTKNGWNLKVQNWEQFDDSKTKWKASKLIIGRS